jgi:hypothetical protein
MPACGHSKAKKKKKEKLAGLPAKNKPCMLAYEAKPRRSLPDCLQSQDKQSPACLESKRRQAKISMLAIEAKPNTA